ncbi:MULTISPECIES: hypothetical protein [unclassified Mesorhizobium]|uniref:hypothetical protein n=1 Tax=unclassified Mesorhizobium TaxID=325217 RepID=UPI000FCBC6A1|nr:MULTISPECIES: hypothetical protein [unclassified Mesorhizobium]TGP22343.1 hypothetical protein EN874_019730 [Mesorhizobium sp. M1D.F.Ca.ET.231.01.1.1]TGP24687.1 hypothetical protein EN877_30465 [Mesorhizobium sp. M1D.F.Ca.ET.234.01.1.1]TGS37290.1 hypothetical protein EN827_30770 [Mesorhizobium sp. M1D.F.Ca.ET.184.01.1.1]TGS58090.1 hypothetical protein EN826_030745 [Mesorhizobium sp. M1D.F.Ca.ET.183.01.1.1]
MTIEIHAHDVALFANGSKVATVTKPGVMKAPSKTGPVDRAFNVGDVVLVDVRGLVLVTPLSFAGATEIARAVIENHPGTVTDSHSLRALATAVVGFAAQVVAPEPVSAAAEPAESPAA